MKDKRLLGCAALLGAAIAFPAGIMLGGRAPEPGVEKRATGAASRATNRPAVRDFYAPSVLDDPYVIQQQLRVVEALELSCRQFGERCPEAKQARARVEEQSAR